MWEVVSDCDHYRWAECFRGKCICLNVFCFSAKLMLSV